MVSKTTKGRVLSAGAVIVFAIAGYFVSYRISLPVFIPYFNDGHEVSDPRPGDYTALFNANDDFDIVLIGSEDCPACEATRNWLAGRRIAFIELELPDDPKAIDLMQRLEVNVIPVVFSRRILIFGYSPEVFDAEFKHLGR